MTVATSVKDSLLGILEELPLESQQEILYFARLLQMVKIVKCPRQSLEGLCADLNINITEADIKEARKEMFGNFPREIEI
jgi:hypothetical protein